MEEVFPLQQSSQNKMFMSPAQVNHFLDFITSPHVIQDLPFGEKTIKLSRNNVVTVPNVIQMLIPETIVKQYLAHAVESNFTPLSRRTLLNILSVCTASTRKSLQGLDYIGSAGAQAFEDLINVAERLGDHLMGMTWAKEQRERLVSAKRYLKSDYKVWNGMVWCTEKLTILLHLNRMEVRFGGYSNFFSDSCSESPHGLNTKFPPAML